MQARAPEGTKYPMKVWERMAKHSGRHAGFSKARGFLWGAAHALDFGALLVEEKDWRGFEADAEALRGDWRVATGIANEEIDVSEASEAE